MNCFEPMMNYSRTKKYKKMNLYCWMVILVVWNEWFLILLLNYLKKNYFKNATILCTISCKCKISQKKCKNINTKDAFLNNWNSFLPFICPLNLKNETIGELYDTVATNYFVEWWSNIEWYEPHTMSINQYNSFDTRITKAKSTFVDCFEISVVVYNNTTRKCYGGKHSKIQRTK